MLLKDKVAVIYGAGGAIGGAVARAFGREGARVFLAGRTLAPLGAVIRDIAAAGGKAEAEQVDALDAGAVDAHLAGVVGKAGRLDISFNLASMGDAQGGLLVDMTAEHFLLPIRNAMNAQFITATAAGRHMAKQGGGVI